MLTGLANLAFGIFYLISCSSSDLFEALVYGAVIIESPQYIFYFMIQLTFPYTSHLTHI